METYTNERKKAKKTLGLVPEHWHILVVNDCLQISELEDLLDMLYVCSNETVEISVFTKKTYNYDGLEKDYSKLDHFHIWKNSTKRAALITSADVLITKPDSDILYRARESHTPMILTAATNITEKINCLFYTNNGYAISAASNEEICDICIELLNNQENNPIT